MHASELQQQVTGAAGFIPLCQQNVLVGDRRIALDKCCVAGSAICPQHQRPQRFDAFGQASPGRRVGRIRHATESYAATDGLRAIRN